MAKTKQISTETVLWNGEAKQRSKVSYYLLETN